MDNNLRLMVGILMILVFISTVLAGDHDDRSIIDDDAQLMFEGTLAKKVSFIPSPKKVINTVYIFKLEDLIKGKKRENYYSIYDTGGELKDGQKMDTVESFRLIEGERYIVYASLKEDNWWLNNVLSVTGKGEVSDASGRKIVGVEGGQYQVEAEASEKSLRYAGSLKGETVEMDPPPKGEIEVKKVDGQNKNLENAPIQIKDLKSFLKSVTDDKAQNKSITPRNRRSVDSEEEGREKQLGNAELVDKAGPKAILTGEHVRKFQSHFHFIPNEAQWGWTNQCKNSWNQLVLPKNGFQLFANKSDGNGNPIRNHPPSGGNQKFEVGVLDSRRMRLGGTDSWEVLDANGICYRWWDRITNEIVETDVLINPAIGNSASQFRKSLTHELGHSLTLAHESRYMALMYPGTFRQPPNYRSFWYSRKDDHDGVRQMLSWVNQYIDSSSWEIARFTDIATWSMAHSNRRTVGSLIMTSISNASPSRDEVVSVRNVHIENRGTKPATNVKLKFHLSKDREISHNDILITTFDWNTFSAVWSGTLKMRIPANVPNGEYFFGWILTTDTDEMSKSNNTALLLKNHQHNFSPEIVQVN